MVIGKVSMMIFITNCSYHWYQWWGHLFIYYNCNDINDIYYWFRDNQWYLQNDINNDNGDIYYKWYLPLISMIYLWLLSMVVKLSIPDAPYMEYLPTFGWFLG